jgi:uncharacterized membrane protein YraQ (UPF0718 family)
LNKGARRNGSLVHVAVTTLSLPSMIMLRKAVKPKLLGLFIAICTVGIILVGYLFNIIQPYLI